MCVTDYGDDIRKPEIQLSNLIKQDFDVELNPAHLRLFIQAKWPQITNLAHRIHEAAES